MNLEECKRQFYQRGSDNDECDGEIPDDRLGNTNCNKCDNTKSCKYYPTTIISPTQYLVINSGCLRLGVKMLSINVSTRATLFSCGKFEHIKSFLCFKHPGKIVCHCSQDNQTSIY